MGKLFYGTQTGTTTLIAEQIQKVMGDLVSEIHGIWTVRANDFAGCDFVILGSSTWGDGELTDDWLDFWPQLDMIDLKDVKVALFSLGDQYGYGHNFVSAMRILYDKVKSKGAVVIADQISVEGFEFSHSESVIDGHFVGLVVDEVNEPEQTAGRIQEWAEQVRACLGMVTA
ncbi:MAG TPA: flavodoxin [Drouetiella sp.]|jgi:flavodoxin I